MRDDLRRALPALSLVLLPLLVKAPLLFGLLVHDPMSVYARLSSGTYRTIFPGHQPTLDPNIAFTSHALGTLAARLVAAGQFPLWNPYEGMGMPLAGELQSAALFPPTWLMLLPSGQLLEHLLFQVVAGLATYALLRQLGVGRAGAWLAGMFFAFNGVFAWLANAVVNPVCFLPVILLGLEKLRAESGRTGGLLVAGGLALSIYAGFPEVAYLDGLLIAAWTLCRLSSLPPPERRGFAIAVAWFGAAGILLAAPLLLAFGDWLGGAHVGEHGAGLRDAHLAPPFAITTIVPYYLGNLYGQHDGFWGVVGGYAGLSPVCLACAGVFGRRERRLRLVLAGWAAITILVSFGAWPLLPLFHLVPLTGQAALFRYLDASWIFAMAVLAGLAMDDLGRGDRRALKAGVALGALALLLTGLGSVAAHVLPGGSLTTLGCAAVQAGALAALALAATRPSWTVRRRQHVIALAGLCEATVLFAAPTLAYPYRADLDLSGIRFLQRHLDFQRFVTLGPITPNYGSYFGIAEVNHDDLPVPRAWTDYAQRHLDPKLNPIVLGPTSVARFLATVPAYAAIGTRYVVTPPERSLPALVQVHADRAMRIYELPQPRPYFVAPGCAIAASGRTDVRVTCARPARLERLELFMPGWSATVDGRDGTIARTGEIFQAVAVPAGTSTVHFAFAPRGWPIGLAAAVLGLAAMLAGCWRWGGATGPYRRR